MSLISRRIRRFPFVWWTCVLALAIITGLFVSNSVAKADESAKQFDGMVNVLVLNHALSAGDVVKTSDLHQASWPRAFVPGVPATNVVGRAVSVSMSAGEALTNARLAGVNVSGAAALLRENEQGITVPVGTDAPPLRVGDNVDVLATFDAKDTGAQPTELVAHDARVINVGTNAMTVAVANVDGAKVAFAAAKGTVSLALIR